jgi:signal transduction histidine kinase
MGLVIVLPGSLMLRSLRFRLLLFIIFVLIVTGGMAAWFASRTIIQRFEDYLKWDQVASEERRQHLNTMLPEILVTHYAQNNGWQQVAPLLQQFGKLTEEHILLTDKEGVVIVDSAGEKVGQALADAPDKLIPLAIKGQIIGAFLVIPFPPVANSSGEREYIDSINRALFLAVGMAGVIAIALTFVLSRGILRRVAALTTAVQKMARGDLHQRVDNGAKDEIGRLAHAFNAMADSLARIEQLRRNMVSDVAHELRTPLSNIRGYLEALQDGVVQPTRETIDSLFEEAMLLNRLVDDLQELALAEAGQLKLARQQVTIAELVDKAMQALQYRASDHQISLQTQVTPDLPAVYVDAERIGQVLRNLLSNAVEYTPPGGQVIVNACQMQDHIEVSVHNHGIGIAPEHLPYLFERFYRVDSSRTRATGGSGLGLAIVKQLVQAHGGRVWAQSVLNQDAKFFFTLPLAARVKEGRSIRGRQGDKETKEIGR